MSSARNAGESAIRLAAEQAVELEAENWRLCGATLVRGVAGELEDENWRLGRASVRGLAGELEDENWRLCSTTQSNLWSWKLRTGDFVVEL